MTGWCDATYLPSSSSSCIYHVEGHECAKKRMKQSTCIILWVTYSTCSRLHCRCVWKLQSLLHKTIRAMCPNTPSELFDPVAFAILCFGPPSQGLQEATQQNIHERGVTRVVSSRCERGKWSHIIFLLCDGSLGIVFLTTWAPVLPSLQPWNVSLHTCLVGRIVGASSSSIVIYPFSGDLWPSVSCGESCLLDSAFLSLNKLPLILHKW